MIKKGVVFGPWVGEFGWELFAWQAYCRSISRNYDYCIGISRPNNEYFYNDFCDKYIPLEPPAGGVADSHKYGGFSDFNTTEFLRSTVEPEILSSYEWRWIPPHKIGNPPYTHWMQRVNVSGHHVVPSYRLFGREVNLRKSEKFDIVIHARNRKVRQEDNWKKEKWNLLAAELKKKGHSVASIGTKSASLHIDGTNDMRDLSTSETTGLLANAMCIIGPSSGPIHLATLCGCPQITWTHFQPQNYSKSRYLYTWNPFNVESVILENSDPEVSAVLQAFEGLR